jgi:hypothetical protein
MAEPLIVGIDVDKAHSVVAIVLPSAASVLRVSFASGVRRSFQARLISHKQASLLRLKPFRFIAFVVPRSACIAEWETANSAGNRLWAADEGGCEASTSRTAD